MGVTDDVTTKEKKGGQIRSNSLPFDKSRISQLKLFIKESVVSCVLLKKKLLCSTIKFTIKIFSFTLIFNYKFLFYNLFL